MKGEINVTFNFIPAKIIAYADEGDKIYMFDEKKVLWEVKRSDLIQSKIEYHGENITITKPPQVTAVKREKKWVAKKI